MNLRESVLSSIQNNQNTTAVDVPEWGDGLSITVRELSLRERDAVQEISDDPEKSPAYSLVTPVVMGCLDETGAPLFCESDVETLLNHGTGPIQRLYKAIMKLSGVDLTDPGEESPAGKPSKKHRGSGKTTA